MPKVKHIDIQSLNQVAKAPNKSKVVQLKLEVDGQSNKIVQTRDHVSIKKNIYVDTEAPSKLRKTRWPECDSCDGSKGCCRHCEMSESYIECHLKAHGNVDCGNQRIQRRQYAKTVVKPAGAKGRGLFAAERIMPGQFIIEYVGEVINEEHCRERLKYNHFYAIYLYSQRENGKSHKYYIDALKKGNDARFANHSCDPNAEARYIYVGNEKHIGLFAIKLIMPGDEITFDYQLENWGSQPVKCLCGSANCTGFMSKQ